MMAAGVGHYLVSSPATSAAFRSALQEAIDDGSRTVPLTITDNDTHEVLEIEFTLIQSRFLQMSADFLGKLADQSTATITAMTHPDLSDTPARLVLVRRATP